MNCNNSSQNLYFLRSKCISKLKFPLITNMGLKSSPQWHIKWRVPVGHTEKKNGPFLLTHQVQGADQPDFSPNNI